MSNRDVVQSHIETLMERILGIEELYVSPTGEIPVTFHSAMYKVRVSPAPYQSPHVEIVAVAVDEVDADPGLYEALNAINRKAAHARAFWTERKVVVATELYGPSVSHEELECCCDEVGVIAHVEGPRLAKTYGGVVAHPERLGEDE